MSTLLDEETVVLDALDFEPGCQVGEEAAEFVVTCRSCDLTVLLCETHVATARKTASDFLNKASRFIYCRRCAAKARSFDELLDVRPL